MGTFFCSCLGMLSSYHFFLPWLPSFLFILPSLLPFGAMALELYCNCRLSVTIQSNCIHKAFMYASMMLDRFAYFFGNQETTIKSSFSQIHGCYLGSDYLIFTIL